MLLRSGYEYSSNTVVSRKRKANKQPTNEQLPSRRQKLNNFTCPDEWDLTTFSVPSSCVDPAIPSASSPLLPLLPVSLSPPSSLPVCRLIKTESTYDDPFPPSPVRRLIRTESTYGNPFSPSPISSSPQSPSYDQPSSSPTLPPAVLTRDLSISSYGTAPLYESQETVGLEDGDSQSNRHVHFYEAVVVHAFLDDDESTEVQTTRYFTDL